MINYKDIIKEGLKQGFSDVAIDISGNESLELSFLDGTLENNTINNSTSIVIKGIYNEKMTSYFTEQEEFDIVSAITEMKNNVSLISSEDEYEIFEGSDKYPTIKQKGSDFSEYSITDKIALLEKMEKDGYKKNKLVTKVLYNSYGETTGYRRLINSKGLDITKKSQYCFIFFGVNSQDKEFNKTGYEFQQAQQFKDLNPEKVIDVSVSKSIDGLYASSMESVHCPVIIENDAMSSLLGAIQGIFSGEAAQRKLTVLLEKENKKIMSEKINLIDNPLIDYNLYSSAFDDEGVACYEKKIIDKGIFKGFVHNLKTAKHFKTKSTGNGFNGGVSFSNLYIENGKTSKEEMIKQTKKGVMIRDLDGLHAGLNPISLDFSLKCSGFLIEDGKISRAVTLIVISGNFLEMMNNISVVGNDLKLGSSKVVSPSIKFEGLSISGN